MINYYLNLNAQSSGDHEIHKESCPYYYIYKNGNNFEFLGSYSNDYDALRHAINKHPNLEIDGCAYCCSLIHKK